MKSNKTSVKRKNSNKNTVTIGFINNKIRHLFSQNTKFERQFSVAWISVDANSNHIEVPSKKIITQ
jgi:hypothetical protein